MLAACFRIGNQEIPEKPEPTATPIKLIQKPTPAPEIEIEPIVLDSACEIEVRQLREEIHELRAKDYVCYCPDVDYD